MLGDLLLSSYIELRANRNRIIFSIFSIAILMIWLLILVAMLENIDAWSVQTIENYKDARQFVLEASDQRVFGQDDLNYVVELTGCDSFRVNEVYGIMSISVGGRQVKAASVFIYNDSYDFLTASEMDILTNSKVEQFLSYNEPWSGVYVTNAFLNRNDLINVGLTSDEVSIEVYDRETKECLLVHLPICGILPETICSFFSFDQSADIYIPASMLPNTSYRGLQRVVLCLDTYEKARNAKDALLNSGYNVSAKGNDVENILYIAAFLRIIYTSLSVIVIVSVIVYVMNALNVCFQKRKRNYLIKAVLGFRRGKLAIICITQILFIFLACCAIGNVLGIFVSKWIGYALMRNIDAFGYMSSSGDFQTGVRTVLKASGLLFISFLIGSILPVKNVIRTDICDLLISKQ